MFRFSDAGRRLSRDSMHFIGVLALIAGLGFLVRSGFELSLHCSFLFRPGG